jgi:hypothetical protein
MTTTRKRFEFKGRTATAQQWGDALGVHRNEFCDTVYSLERLGAPRKVAVELTIRHLAKDTPTPEDLLKALNKALNEQV